MLQLPYTSDLASAIVRRRCCVVHGSRCCAGRFSPPGSTFTAMIGFSPGWWPGTAALAKGTDGKQHSREVRSVPASKVRRARWLKTVVFSHAIPGTPRDTSFLSFTLGRERLCYWLVPAARHAILAHVCPSGSPHGRGQFNGQFNTSFTTCFLMDSKMSSGVACCTRDARVKPACW